MSQYTRRAILTSAGAFAGAYTLPAKAYDRYAYNIVVIGGGFAGGAAAKFLSGLRENIFVTLVSGNAEYHPCPLSNRELVGLSGATSQNRPNYKDNEIRVINDFAVDILPPDETANNFEYNGYVRTANGKPILYDFIILAPGVDINYNALDGYSPRAEQALPHAWKAGAQTYLLRDQLHAMPDGGTVVITTPPAPYRCPPGPYERASLIAHYLKTHKPLSKVLLLDSNQTFSKQALFEAAWERFYPGMIERRGPNDDGRIIGVNAKSKSVITDFDEISGDIVNVIPPQRAGEIARIAGVTDASGWCPVDPVTFESTLRKNIFVIGDAAQVSPMPKSAFAAAQQARICALNLARRIQGLEPIAPIISNTCYSFLTPERACSITGVYQAENGKLLPVSGAGGQSPIADEDLELKEAGQAKAIIDSLLTGAFG